jgi:hypothetical protein
VAGAGHVLLARRGSPLLCEALRRGLAARPFSWAALMRESRQADLIHVHDAHSHTCAAVLGGVPIVVSRRVAFPLKRHMLSEWKYARARHYLAVSEHVASALADSGIPAARISVVYDGVHLPPQPASGDRVIAPAFQDAMKGDDLVPRSVERSADLAADLPSSRLFVYISRSEGLGSAALLAMAHGVAVVASRVGGLPEIVEDGVTGVLTENSPAAIREAIERALVNPAEMGRRGRQRVQERFTVSHMVQNTLAAYEKVLG